MLTGQELGNAIAEAIKKKGVTKAAVAQEFGVKPPSVQDWIKRGTIAKDKLPQLWDYFANVVDASHWGLEVLPKLSAPVNAPIPMPTRPALAWPFEGIDCKKVLALAPSDIARLEGALLLAAGQMRLDIALIQKSARAQS